MSNTNDGTANNTPAEPPAETSRAGRPRTRKRVRATQSAATQGATVESPAVPSDADPYADQDWPVWARPALDMLRITPNVTSAARQLGIARSTLNRLIAIDETYKLAVFDAREQALDTLEDVILARARQGQPIRKTVTKTMADGTVETTVTDEAHISDTLAMFFLKRWRPEYRESYRVEQTGPGGGPIQIEGSLSDAVDRFNAEVVRLAAIAAAGDPSS